MTTVTGDQLDAITPTPPLLSGPMVITTLSCPQPNTTVCRVTGRVDLITVPVLTDGLIDALRDGRSHLVVDLSAASLVDSTAVLAAFDALDCYDIDGHLAVVIDPRSEALTRPEIAEMDEILDIHHDLAGALRACARAFISTGGRHRAKTTDWPCA
ncbi:MAG: STAS domain-containing protein [Actinomycetota bacterium]|nr:STAS domain-containing protein [Actinomycetota bacterium]